jgi:hypothetical protein
MAVDLILSTDLVLGCSFLTTFGQMTRRGQVVCSAEVALSNFAFARLVPKRYEEKKFARFIGGLPTNRPPTDYPSKN